MRVKRLADDAPVAVDLQQRQVVGVLHAREVPPSSTWVVSPAAESCRSGRKPAQARVRSHMRVCPHPFVSQCFVYSCALNVLNRHFKTRNDEYSRMLPEPRRAVRVCSSDR